MPEKSKTDIISENLIRAFAQFRRFRMIKDDSWVQEEHCGVKHSEIMLLFELKEMEKDHPDGVSVSDLSSKMCVQIGLQSHQLSLIWSKRICWSAKWMQMTEELSESS